MRIRAFVLAFLVLSSAFGIIGSEPADSHANSCCRHSSCGLSTVSRFNGHVYISPTMDNYRVYTPVGRGRLGYNHTDYVYCGH